MTDIHSILNGIIDRLTADDLQLAYATRLFAYFSNDTSCLIDLIDTKEKEYGCGTKFFWPLFGTGLDVAFFKFASSSAKLEVNFVKIVPDSERDIDDNVTDTSGINYEALVDPEEFPMFKSRSPGNIVIGIKRKYSD